MNGDFHRLPDSRSLNQNLPSVLDVDALLRGQRGDAAAGEIKEFTI